MRSVLGSAIRLTFAVSVSSLLIAGCTSSNVDVTAPTGPKCQVTATSSMATAPAGGAAATVTVDTTRDCTWTATSDASWITLGSTTAGQGSGSLDLHIGANQTPAPREGTVLVNDSQVMIDQAAAACTFSVTPSAPTASAGGGTIAVQVGTLSGCAWSTATGASWLTVSAGSNGPGQATITVGANTSAQRSGTLTVAGQTVTVTQAADATIPAPIPMPTPAPGPTPSCMYTLSPASGSAEAVGGSVSVGLTAGTGCTWTTQMNASWITVVSGLSGTGSATIVLAILPNLGAARDGTATIGGQTFNVSQAAALAPPPACMYTLASSSASEASQGGSVPVGVTAGNGCAWTATANVSWITIVGPRTGTGNGTVTLSIAANTGAARLGTATIAGNTFTVNQAALACQYTLSPMSAKLGSGAGGGTITVTTTTGCSWTATPQDSWISISGSPSGSGNGMVRYTVTANTDKDRSGEIAIADQTFTVTQMGKN